MRIENIIIENFRQLVYADLQLEEIITILAGSNNSGKTSFIDFLLKITDKKRTEMVAEDYSFKKMLEWKNDLEINLESIFESEETFEELEGRFLEAFVKKDESDEYIHKLDDISLKLHVVYDKSEENYIDFVDYFYDVDETKNDFYFMFSHELNTSRFVREYINVEKFNFLKRRFLRTKKTDLMTKKTFYNFLFKDVFNYFEGNYYYCNEDFMLKSKMSKKEFLELFNIGVIAANRDLGDIYGDKQKTLTDNILKYFGKTPELTELLSNIVSEMIGVDDVNKVNKKLQEVSTKNLQELIKEISKSNNSKNSIESIVLNLDLEELGLAEFFGRNMSTNFEIGNMSLSENSQGLGYSNLIHLHFEIERFMQDKDPMKVNFLIIEEPEAHMHPQMQNAFKNYLIKYLGVNKNQTLITTHSSEMIGLSEMNGIRVLRTTKMFESELFDIEVYLETKDLTQIVDSEIGVSLKSFYRKLFNINFSNLIFSNKVILYEGDTENILIKKIISESYPKLQTEYISFVQVGGAYAHIYYDLLEFLKVKSIVFTDIDYDRNCVDISGVLKSKTTNQAIIKFYSEYTTLKLLTIDDFYKASQSGALLRVFHQSVSDGYSRTLEEAILVRILKSYDLSINNQLSKKQNLDVFCSLAKSIWMKIKKEIKVKIPISQKNFITIKDIYKGLENKKTNFMFQVILSEKFKQLIPNYIINGLEWLQDE